MKVKMGINKKLIITIIQLVIFIILSIMISNYLELKEKLMEDVRDEMQQATESNALIMEAWIGRIFGGLDSVQNVIETVELEDDEECLSFLKTTLTLNESLPYGIYGGNASGYYMDASEWKPEPGWKIEERSWYQGGLLHTKFALGRPYLDVQSGDFVVSASVKMKKGNEDFVAATEIMLNEISNDMSEV